VSKEACDVLHERDAGSYLAKHPEEVGPKITLVGGSPSLPGDAVGLAGNASKDEIHASTPGSPVEATQVVPDGGGLQVAGLHPALQKPLAVGVSLDVADGSGEADGLEGCGADPASGTYVQAT